MSHESDIVRMPIKNIENAYLDKIRGGSKLELNIPNAQCAYQCRVPSFFLLQLGWCGLVEV